MHMKRERFLVGHYRADARHLAFCQLAALGFPLKHASAFAGLSPDTSNASKLARRADMAGEIERLKGMGPYVPRAHAFAAVALVTGSATKGYHAAFEGHGLSYSALRQRAARYAKREDTALAIIETADRPGGCPVHADAWNMLTRAEAIGLRAKAKAEAVQQQRWQAEAKVKARAIIAERFPKVHTFRIAHDARQAMPNALKDQPPKVCGARTKHGNGAPCQLKPIEGRTRCKWHGGLSTGPRTAEGKAKCQDGVKRWREQQVA